MHDVCPLRSASHGEEIRGTALGRGRLGEDPNHKPDSAFPLVRIEGSKMEDWQSR